MLLENTKKMTHFYGCHNLVMLMLFLIMIIFFSFLEASMAEPEKSFFETLSREEMVQIAGYGEEKLSTVIVTGSVLCEACLLADQETWLHAWPVSGALVAISCNTSGKKSKGSWAQAVTTDEYGDFIIDLPSHLHAIPNLDKSCCIKILQIPKTSLCRPAYVRKHHGLRLSSVGNGIRAYTAGRIRFLQSASKPAEACIKKGDSDKEISW